MKSKAPFIFILISHALMLAFLPQYVQDSMFEAHLAWKWIGAKGLLGSSNQIALPILIIELSFVWMMFLAWWRLKKE